VATFKTPPRRVSKEEWEKESREFQMPDYYELEEKWAASVGQEEARIRVKELNLFLCYSTQHSKLLENFTEEEIAKGKQVLEMYKKVIPAPPPDGKVKWWGLENIDFSKLEKNTVKNYCVNCGSTAVKILKKLVSKRPNGERMEQMKCKECKCVWEE